MQKHKHDYIQFTSSVTFIFPWAHMLCVAESSRSAQRRPGAPADGSGSLLCGWAPAESWEWKARGCSESTERTVELHRQPRGEGSLLPQRPPAQERHCLQWFKQPGCPGLAFNFFYLLICKYSRSGRIFHPVLWGSGYVWLILKYKWS